MMTWMPQPVYDWHLRAPTCVMIHALHQCANVIAGNVVSITQQYIERNKHLILILIVKKNGNAETT